MKVLMIDYALPGNKYVDGLALELSKKTDFRVMVEARHISEMNNAYRNLPILYNGGKKGIFALIAYGISLLRLFYEIIAGNYDIVHVQTFKIPKVEIALYKFVKHFIKGKLIHTAHNVNPHEKEIASNDVFGKFYTLCDGLFVHNEYSKSVLCHQYGIPEEKIIVISHGVYANGDSKFNGVISDPGKKHTFLFFGQIRKYKGIDILLTAISKIPKSEREKMRFIIAGRHHKLDITDYEKMAKDLGIADYVKFHIGFISDEDKANYFLSSDACICPYREIYGSGVLMEAYTYRCPVIVSNFPVFIEETANGRTGLLFKSGDPDALAKVLQQFVYLPKEQKKEYRKNISKLVEEKYNWKKSSIKTYYGYELFLNR